MLTWHITHFESMFTFHLRVISHVCNWSCIEIQWIYHICIFWSWVLKLHCLVPAALCVNLPQLQPCSFCLKSWFVFVGTVFPEGSFSVPFYHLFNCRLSCNIKLAFFNGLIFSFFFVFSLQITCHESFSFLVSSLGPDQRKSTQSFSISLRHALGNQKAAIKKFVRLVITEFINCSLPA